MARGLTGWLLALVLAACLGGPPTPGPSDVRVLLEEVASGFASPVFATSAPDGSGRLFVVEQAGVVRVLKGGQRLERPFLDITDLVESGGERGLFSIAFPPDFNETRAVYVSYTKKGGDSVVAHYPLAEGEEDVLDASSGAATLTQSQPQSNHNGGMILFGPDGYLYIGFGDGGGAGDRGSGHASEGNGQSLGTWLGKLLRIDVSGTQTYTVPDDNPDLGAGARPEIWAYGLRNPWRFGFDRETGDLWIGDVGQWEREEIDFQAAASRGGENYGWNVFEGTKRFRAGEAKDHVPPVYDYSRAGGHCSVTGGYVYRGEAIPALRGAYVFGDYCSGLIWSLAKRGEEWDARLLLESGLSISSFGEDAAGEILVVHHGGSVHRLVPYSGASR